MCIKRAVHVADHDASLKLGFRTLWEQFQTDPPAVALQAIELLKKRTTAM